MGATTQLGLLISANASGGGAIDNLANQVGKLVDNIDKAHESAKKPGFDKFAESVKSFIQNPLQQGGEAVEGFLKKMGPMGAAVGVGAVALGALGAAAYKSMRELAELGDRTGDIAVRMGLTAKEVGQFSFAMKRAGGDISSLETAMRALSQGLASGGEEGKNAREALSDLGVRARDANGNLRPMGVILSELADKLNGVGDTANRNTLAIKLFGRAGLELLPDLLELREGLDRAKQLNLGLTDADLKRYGEYQKQLTDISAMWSELSRKMKEPLVGALYVWLKAMTEGSPTNGVMVVGHGAAVIAPKIVPQGPEYDPEADAKFAAEQASIARGSIFLRGLQSRRGGTIAGLQDLSRDAKSRADKLWGELVGLEGSGEDVIRKKAAEWQAAESAAARYEARVKSIKEREDLLKDTEKLLSGPYANMMRYGTTENWGIRKNQTLPSDLVTNSVMNEYGYWMTGAGMKFGSGFDQRPGNDWWATQERLEKASLDHRIRMVELLSGPGGEVQAVERVYQLRMAAAKTEEEAQAAAIEREERIAQIQRQRVEQWASTVSGAFNALVSGGRGGLGSFAKSQIVGMGSTVAGNVARMSFGAIQKALPNAAEGSFLGKLLVGTPFGPDANAIATDANTKATQENTTAIRALATSATGGGGGLVRGAMYGGGYLGNGIYSMLGGGGDPYSSENGELASLMGISRGWGIRNQDGSLNKIGTAGVLAAGGFGVYQGIKMGGGRGALTAISSAAGTAAALDPEPISKAILTGVALASGFATMLFGDPKQKRGKEIEDWTAGHQNSEPVPVNIVRDSYGRERWEDYRGGMHSGNTIIYAMDAQSFTEFAERNPEGFNRGVKAMVNSGGEGVPALQSAMGLA